MYNEVIAIEPWARLLAANELLATARSMDQIVTILRDTARDIAEAEGIAIVFKEQDCCFYAVEDSKEPLWAGQRFPATSCISGWAMLHRQTAAVPDIRLDARIPQEAYRKTFVRSLVLVPIGAPEPVAALGAYWSNVRHHDEALVTRLEALGRAASIALQNVRLMDQIRTHEQELRDLNATLERRVEERTLQLSKTEEALRQAQRLEAMGQLTGGVAHDFNNLLMPIIGGLDLVLRSGVGGPREKRLMEGAMEAAQRAKNIIQRLLAFARRQPLKIAPVDVADLLRGMGMLVATTVGPDIDLEFNIAPDLPLARADANQIEVALLNLVLNARDAMPEGGTLIVTAERDAAGADNTDGVAPGEYVLITVSDDGQGMDEETRLRATEPFFSTKGVGKGSGLGLSMVHGLMSQLDGGFSVTSAAGIGTSVKLRLPISQEKAAAAAPSVNGADLPCGLVMLVDDDERVRATTADMLIDLGYSVIEASSGAEALRELEANPSVSLLVADHVMPGMSGVQLAAAVRRQRPDIGILVISGYADIASLSGDFARLEKPFRRAELAASLRLTARKSPHAHN